MQRQTAAVLYLTLENAAGETAVLGVTAEHPLYDAAAGWTEAGDLIAGDIVLDAMLAPLSVLALRVDDTPQLVHNLEVGGAHTYFAGEMAAWAHNAIGLKPGGGGRLQAYDTKTGRYVSTCNRPSVANNLIAHFGAGFTFGYADASGNPPRFPPSPQPRTRSGVAGYYCGYAAGWAERGL